MVICAMPINTEQDRILLTDIKFLKIIVRMILLFQLMT